MTIPPTPATREEKRVKKILFQGTDVFLAGGVGDFLPIKVIKDKVQVPPHQPQLNNSVQEHNRYSFPPKYSCKWPLCLVKKEVARKVQ